VKAAIVLATGLVLLVVLAAFLTLEAPLALLFGWVPFLMRVLPKVTVDGPSAAVGGIAALLLAFGVHRIGRAWRPWKVRWSLTVVAGICLLFAAGVAVVGAAHQIIWLLTDNRPAVGEGVSYRWGGHSSKNNLRDIGIGMTTHHDQLGFFPAGTFTPEGEMLHSWETQILPFMVYSTREIDFKRPWNDPVNRKYFQCVIPEFLNPELRVAPAMDGDGYGLSHYAANGRVLGPNRQVKLKDLPAGAANTALVGEVDTNFKPWGYPVNWRDPALGINRSPDGFGGPNGGAQFLMADGSVRFVSDTASPEALRALSSPPRPQ
jgi:prepilin-type processing-associated H-X9-DG protein